MKEYNTQSGLLHDCEPDTQDTKPCVHACAHIHYKQTYECMYVQSSKDTNKTLRISKPGKHPQY